MWFAHRQEKPTVVYSSLGPFNVLPPPPPTRIVETEILVTQIIDWIKFGDHEQERKAWVALSDFAKEQSVKAIL